MSDRRIIWVIETRECYMAQEPDAERKWKLTQPYHMYCKPETALAFAEKENREDRFNDYRAVPYQRMLPGQQMLAILELPAKPNEKLRRLLTEPGVIEGEQ